MMEETMLRFASGATLALTVCVMLGSTALADSQPTKNPAPASPAAQLPMKASKPRVQPDTYCTNNSVNSSLPACNREFKQACTKSGGKVKDPSGNPDYGVCVHDDLW
jgi:hypothetical protein